MCVLVVHKHYICKQEYIQFMERNCKFFSFFFLLLHVFYNNKKEIIKFNVFVIFYLLII